MWCDTLYYKHKHVYKYIHIQSWYPDNLMLLVCMIIPFNHHDHIMLWNTSPWNPSKNPYCWWWIPPQMDIYICICLDCIPIKSHLYHSFHLPSCSTVKPSAELAQAVRTLSPGSWARATGYWANCKRLRVKEACGSIGLKKHTYMYIYIYIDPIY